jgi:hypothetical protein
LYLVFLTALEMKQELWGLALIALGFPAGAGGDYPCGLVAAAGLYGDVY